MRVVREPPGRPRWTAFQSGGKDAVFRFTAVQPTLEDYWRSIILFGKDSASYKFALGKALLELPPAHSEIITLDELAEPFAQHICSHLKLADKQGTAPSSQFLEACRTFNRGELTKEELLASTVRLGFGDVIGAFHVTGDPDAVRFYADERSGRKTQLRLTDEFFRLSKQNAAESLSSELEARWRLVETAWELTLPQHVIEYDSEAEQLTVKLEDTHGRRPVTNCRDALNGYQKGKCFYCFTAIVAGTSLGDPVEVDHFFPHRLKPHGLGAPIDGIWNLVLSCQQCNRGPGGKFDQVPGLRLVERLHTRNSFLIESHHPLRQTLMLQLGTSETSRGQFLQAAYDRAKKLLVHEWLPASEDDRAF